LHSQPVEDISPDNPSKEDVEQIVAHAIFADAAGAIVLPPQTAPARRSGPVVEIGRRQSSDAPAFEVVDVTALTDWTTQDLMRWDVTDLGFRMALSAEVPRVLAQHVRTAVESLLAEHDYTVEDVAG